MVKKVIVKNYDISKQSLRGMTPEQYICLMEYQNFTCPLSGKKFEYSKEEQKFLDVEDKREVKRSPTIDHDHNTLCIRGILTDKVNMLLDQWEKKTYGKLSKPDELTKYQQNPPAFECIGKVIYK